MVANPNARAKMREMRSDREIKSGDGLPEVVEPRRTSRVDPVDRASEESFPASDPPSWAPLHSGSPVPPTPTAETAP